MSVNFVEKENKEKRRSFNRKKEKLYGITF